MEMLERLLTRPPPEQEAHTLKSCRRAHTHTRVHAHARTQDLAGRLKQVLLTGPAPEKEEAQGITLAAVNRRIMQVRGGS